MGQALFRGDRIEHARLVWDPAVHERYDESCHFLLLRLHRPDSRTLEQVEAIGSRLGIESLSSYYLLGFWDVLLRVWTTSEDFQAFVGALRQDLPIEQHESFAVAEIDYSDWADQSFSIGLRDVVLNQSHVETMCDANSPADEIEAARRALESAKLVHICDPEEHFARNESPLLKLYVALRRTSNDSDPLNAAAMSDISHAVRSIGVLRMISLYFGSGRNIDCLVKGVISTRELPALRDAIFKLQMELERLKVRLRPMTLLIANNDASEKDLVVIDRSKLGSIGRMIRAIVGTEFAVQFRRLTPKHANTVVDVFEEQFAWFVETELEADFVGIIESGISLDTRLFRKSCHFLTEMEGEFRNAVIRRILPQALGRRQWRDTVIRLLQDDLTRVNDELMSAAPADPATLDREARRLKRELEALKESPDDLGFGEYVNLLVSLVDRGHIGAGEPRRWLGETWRGDYLQAVALRNEVQHAKIAPFDQEGVEHWAVAARRACNAGKVYLRLRRVAEGG